MRTRPAMVQALMFLAISMSATADGAVVQSPRIEPVDVQAEKDLDHLTETAAWKPVGAKLLSPWRHSGGATKTRARNSMSSWANSDC